MSANPPPLPPSQRKGLCKWFIAWGGETQAFMRLTQSKLLRAIPHAEDISRERGGEGGVKRRGGGAAGSPWVQNHRHSQTVLNVSKGNEEEERGEGGLSRASITLSGRRVRRRRMTAESHVLAVCHP